MGQGIMGEGKWLHDHNKPTYRFHEFIGMAVDVKNV